MHVEKKHKDDNKDTKKDSINRTKNTTPVTPNKLRNGDRTASIESRMRLLHVQFVFAK